MPRFFTLLPRRGNLFRGGLHLPRPTCRRRNQYRGRRGQYGYPRSRVNDCNVLELYLVVVFGRALNFVDHIASQITTANNMPVL